jgi:hypothetical protein
MGRKIVCGHAHPHQIRPKITVNKLMKIKKVTNPIATKWKSCGKNGTPQKINLRSNTLNRNMGWPFTSIQGRPNKAINKKYEK